jgi:hypothetical protein
VNAKSPIECDHLTRQRGKIINQGEPVKNTREIPTFDEFHKDYRNFYLEKFGAAPGEEYTRRLYDRLLRDMAPTAQQLSAELTNQQEK